MIVQGILDCTLCLKFTSSCKTSAPLSSFFDSVNLESLGLQFFIMGRLPLIGSELLL